MNGAGNREDEIGLVDGVHIGAGDDLRRDVPDTVREFVQARLHGDRRTTVWRSYGGEHEGAGFPDGSGGTDDRDGGLFHGDFHDTGGFAKGLDSHEDGVAIAGGDGEFKAVSDGLSGIPDDRSIRSKTEQLCAEFFGHVTTGHDFFIGDFDRDAHHSGRGEGAGDEPTFEFASGGGRR